jgi:hypothetical protein
MKMNDRIPLLISILNVIIAAFVPAVVALHLYERGAVPEKDVLITKTIIDPLADLSKVVLGTGMVRLVSGDSTISVLGIEKTTITNIGQPTILAQDFFSGFSVRVKEPWTILTVDSSSSKMRVNWKAQSKTEWVMEPLLLNQNDTVDLNVYYTTAENRGKLQNESPTTWDVRIAGLKQPKLSTYSSRADPVYTSPRTQSLLQKLLNTAGTWVSGANVMGILFLFIVFSYAHLWIAGRVGVPFLKVKTGVLAGWIGVCVALCAAEALATYVFTMEYRTDWDMSFHLFNLFPISLNALILWSGLRAAAAR